MRSLIPYMDSGEVPGVPFPFEEVIETSSSKVYLAGERAYKVYKQENHHYGDFGNEDFRRAFMEDERHWNMVLSPETYLEFRGMSFVDDRWRKSELNGEDDVLIVMKRVMVPNLTSLLRSGTASRDQMKEAIRIMTARVDALAPFVGVGRYPFRAQGLQSIFLDFVGSVYAWAPQADPVVPTAWSIGAADAISAFVRRSAYFAHFPDSHISASVDCHSDNIFFQGDVPIFLDSMLSKEGWRISDVFCNTAKFATDVTAYCGETVRDMLYAEYALQHPLPPPDIRNLYEATFALLKCIYVGLLGPQDAIPRYREIVDVRISALQ